jgi:hypothetical protein
MSMISGHGMHCFYHSRFDMGLCHVFLLYLVLHTQYDCPAYVVIICSECCKGVLSE